MSEELGKEQPALSRRSFLKGSGALGATVALSAVPGLAQAEVPPGFERHPDFPWIFFEKPKAGGDYYIAMSARLGMADASVTYIKPGASKTPNSMVFEFGKPPKEWLTISTDKRNVGLVDRIVKSVKIYNNALLADKGMPASIVIEVTLSEEEKSRVVTYVIGFRPQVGSLVSEAFLIRPSS